MGSCLPAGVRRTAPSDQRQKRHARRVPECKRLAASVSDNARPRERRRKRDVQAAGASRRGGRRARKLVDTTCSSRCISGKSSSHASKRLMLVAGRTPVPRGSCHRRAAPCRSPSARAASPTSARRAGLDARAILLARRSASGGHADLLARWRRNVHVILFYTRTPAD